MRHKIIVIGPAFSQTGYGEQCRFALRSLMSRVDFMDVFLKPTEWGKSSWLLPNDEDRPWLDSLVRKTHLYLQGGGTFDVSLQVTIPNEWAKVAPINIGYTAGIETNKVAPQWLEKAALMDKIIVVSHHSRNVFLDTVYDATVKETGQNIKLKCVTPIEVVSYPARQYECGDISLNLDYDFNYLTVSQWGPRKNLDNTIKWWVEEFKDDEVGLVVKTNLIKTSIIDRLHTARRLQGLLGDQQDRKCKVYLLHGNMTPQEMTALYQHPKIKCLVSLSHGEGFGLPLYEAAYNALPVMAPDWSGHKDFLYARKKVKRKKKITTRSMPHFCVVDHKLGQVSPDAVWDGVVQADSMWCYAAKDSYQKSLRKVLTRHAFFKKQAVALQKYVCKEFETTRQLTKFVDAMALNNVNVENDDNWASDIESLIHSYE